MHAMSPDLPHHRRRPATRVDRTGSKAMRRLGALAWMVLSMFVVNAAFATEVTYRYSGSVVSNSVAGADAQFLGQDWTAVLTFDDSTSASSAAPSSFPNATIFLGAILSYEIEFSSGLRWSLLSADERILQVANDLEARPGVFNDRFTVHASFEDMPSGLGSVQSPTLVLSLIDYTPDVFSSLSLPDDPVGVNDFNVSVGSLIFPSGGGLVGLDVDSVELVPVPEPSAALFLGVGLALLARRRQQVR